jgi:hypothetical protein
MQRAVIQTSYLLHARQQENGLDIQLSTVFFEEKKMHFSAGQYKSQVEFFCHSYITC